MFKKDNEQEEKYAQNQQQRMRGNVPPQYGQSNQYNTQYTKEAAAAPNVGTSFDPTTIRMRQFQQQQQRMQQMQNISSQKQQYPKPVSPLTSIPETYQGSPINDLNLRHSGVMDIHSRNSNQLPSVTQNSSSIPASNLEKQQNKLDGIDDSSSASVSNVMEDLINIAESVVASKNSSATPSINNKENTIQRDLPHAEASKYLIGLNAQYSIELLLYKFVLLHCL